MKKKAPTKRRVVKKAKAKKTTTKRKAATVHTDKNSHNVKISIISGEIAKGKTKLVENLKHVYGKYAADLVTAKTAKERNHIKKQMQLAKSQIKKIKS